MYVIERKSSETGTVRFIINRKRGKPGEKLHKGKENLLRRILPGS